MKKYHGMFARSASCPGSVHEIGSLIFLWAAGILPEATLHIATSVRSGFFDEGLFLSILFAAVPALLIWGLMWLIPSKQWKKALLIVYSLIVFIFCASQLIYYRIFGCFYSAYSMANGGQAFQFWRTAAIAISRSILPLVLMVLPLLCVCIFGHRFVSKQSIAKKILSLIPISAAILMQITLIVTLPLWGGTDDMSPYDLYHNNGDAYYSVNRLGLFTAFRLDITRMMTGHQPSGSIQIDETTAPTDPVSPTVPETTGFPPVTEPDPSTAPTIDTSPNQLNIDFESLINEASSSDVSEIHQYFRHRTPSRKNEKTGIFKDCNLILITAEAFSSLVVDEQRTPTLYTMMHDGFYFTDYYVPDWGTSTTDGEYAFLTSTVPKANTWSFSDSSDNYMPLTMCAQLKAMGYQAFAYHGHTYNYYDRNAYLENLGYVYRAYGQGLDIDYTWPESDVQVIDQTTDDYAFKEPFTAYYMTISGHREFNFNDNYIAYQNRDLVKDEPYSEGVRAYIATQLELEHSLALLMERLKEAGTLDNTVFVLTADHYPNGLTHSELSELLGHPIETNFELYKNRCIIYKPGMTPETIDTPCSHLDLLPTLSNLFGLEFDSRLYMGRDVFSDASPLVMFRNRSWITDTASCNFTTGEIIPRTQAPVTDEYVSRIQKEVSNRFAVSSRILDYDYWNILFGNA